MEGQNKAYIVTNIPLWVSLSEQDYNKGMTWKNAEQIYWPWYRWPWILQFCEVALIFVIYFWMPAPSKLYVIFFSKGHRVSQLYMIWWQMFFPQVYLTASKIIKPTLHHYVKFCSDQSSWWWHMVTQGFLNGGCLTSWI